MKGIMGNAKEKKDQHIDDRHLKQKKELQLEEF